VGVLRSLSRAARAVVRHGHLRQPHEEPQPAYPQTRSRATLVDCELADAGADAGIGIRLVGLRQYAEAAPYLAELISRLRDVDDPAIVKQLEGMYFFLGIGYFYAGMLQEAVDTLHTYMQRYGYVSGAPARTPRTS
jgi:hypothetical protein